MNFDSWLVMTGRTPGWALEELKAPEAFDEERGGLCGEDSATVDGRPRMGCAGWTTAPRARALYRAVHALTGRDRAGRG